MNKDADIEVVSFDEVVSSFDLLVRNILRLVLLMVSIFCICRALGYSPLLTPEQLPFALNLLTTYVNIGWFSLAWLIAGLVALIGIPKARLGFIAGAVAMSMVWALPYTVSWILALATEAFDSPNERDYLSASIYWAVGVLALACRFLGKAAQQASALIQLLNKRVNQLRGTEGAGGV